MASVVGGRSGGRSGACPGTFPRRAFSVFHLHPSPWRHPPTMMLPMLLPRSYFTPVRVTLTCRGGQAAAAAAAVSGSRLLQLQLGAGASAQLGEAGSGPPQRWLLWPP